MEWRDGNVLPTWHGVELSLQTLPEVGVVLDQGIWIRLVIFIRFRKTEADAFLYFEVLETKGHNSCQSSVNLSDGIKMLFFHK